MNDRRAWSRRKVLRSMAAIVAGSAIPGRSRSAPGRGPAPHLMRLVARPPQLETEGIDLDSWETPNTAFFVRSHFEVPAPDLLPGGLEIATSGGAGVRMTVAELRSLPSVELPAVLQCAGNGRSFFQPPVAGIPWGRGAVGNARWRGVPLIRILEAAGVPTDREHVHFRGLDVPYMPATPAWIRSLPRERALDPATLVAYEMNGEALPSFHGGPIRLVVPGWSGNHWMKWLGRIQVAPEPAEGFFQATAYRMPSPAGPAPLTVLPVKSWITDPVAGTALEPGPVEIRGHALSGAGEVTGVEISVDGGASFRPARVDPLRSPGAWQTFRFTWKPDRPGAQTLMARATDRTGAVQPRTTPPNPSGYLWNGWDAVPVVVR